MTPLVEDGAPCGRHFDGEFVQAFRCPDCAYVRFPDPPQERLERYYNDEYPKSARDWYNLAADYNPMKTMFRADQLERIIAAYGIQQGAALHEFGCAFGGTVAELARRGYDASGSELNESAVAEGRPHCQNRIHAISALEYLKTNPGVKVLYAFHALEHFVDPFSFLAEAKALIDEDGLIVQFVPSSAARFPMIYGHARYSWFAYPDHVHLFSPRSALSLSDRIGCHLLAVETREFGLEPELTAEALHMKSEGARVLGGGDIGLLGEEIAIVMTPSTRMADRFRESVVYARAQCLFSGGVERRALAAAETKVVDPCGKRRA